MPTKAKAKPDDKGADPKASAKGKRAPLSGGHWVTIHYADGDSRHVYFSGPRGERGAVVAGMGVGHRDIRHKGKTVARVEHHPEGHVPRAEKASGGTSLKDRTRLRLETSKATKGFDRGQRKEIAGRYRELRGAKQAPAPSLRDRTTQRLESAKGTKKFTPEARKEIAGGLRELRGGKAKTEAPKPAPAKARKESVRERNLRVAGEVVEKVRSGEAARETFRQTIANRVNPLVKRGSRLSAFRPAPGSPKFQQAVHQTQMHRQWNAQQRAAKAIPADLVRASAPGQTRAKSPAEAKSIMSARAQLAEHREKAAAATKAKAPSTAREKAMARQAAGKAESDRQRESLIQAAKTEHKVKPGTTAKAPAPATLRETAAAHKAEAPKVGAVKTASEHYSSDAASDAMRSPVPPKAHEIKSHLSMLHRGEIDDRGNTIHQSARMMGVQPQALHAKLVQLSKGGGVEFDYADEVAAAAAGKGHELFRDPANGKPIALWRVMRMKKFEEAVKAGH